MKQTTFLTKLIFLLLAILTCSEITRAQSSNEIQTRGRVCPNPSSPCVKVASNVAKVFEDANLSFKLPAKLIWQHNYYSASFYAVILKSRPVVVDKNPMEKSKCDQGYYPEEERREVQKIFPLHKVFASRNGCYMPIIWYTNDAVGEGNKEFIAVFAGNTEAEAKRFLKKVTAEKEFSGATYRKMQVVFGYGD